MTSLEMFTVNNVWMMMATALVFVCTSASRPWRRAAQRREIYVQPLERVIRIRTGEEDDLALTPVNAEEVMRHAE